MSEMNQEYIIENAGRVPFRDMCEANQIAILNAKLNVPESVEWHNGRYWNDSEEACVAFGNAYRVRAIATPLNIPWEWIAPEWDWAAMDASKVVYFFNYSPMAGAAGVWVCNSGNYLNVRNILNIDTTGIDWRRSKTRRPV